MIYQARTTKSFLHLVVMLQTVINTIIIIVSKCNCMEYIVLHDAISRMRELTKLSIPFSFEYIACNRTIGTSTGTKKVNKALLRTGMGRDKSINSEILIGYYIEPAQEPRWFYMPLLIKFNGISIRP